MLLKELANGRILRGGQKLGDDQLALRPLKSELPDVIEHRGLDRPTHRAAAQDEIVDSRFGAVETSNEHRADPAKIAEAVLGVRHQELR